MMVIGQGKMNLDASCVSRRPSQRRKRCLLALLHSEAGDLEALGMDVLHAKMLRVRPGAAEKRCARRRAQWKKERQEKAWTGIRCRNMACPGVAGRAFHGQAMKKGGNLAVSASGKERRCRFAPQALLRPGLRRTVAGAGMKARQKDRSGAFCF